MALSGRSSGGPERPRGTVLEVLGVPQEPLLTVPGGPRGASGASFDCSGGPRGASRRSLLTVLEVLGCLSGSLLTVLEVLGEPLRVSFDCSGGPEEASVLRYCPSTESTSCHSSSEASLRDSGLFTRSPVSRFGLLPQSGTFLREVPLSFLRVFKERTVTRRRVFSAE